MTAIELFGLSLPFYVVVISLFSYLVWSKFLKKNKLQPENIIDLFDILLIFVFTLISFLGVTFLILITVSFLNLDINLSNIWRVTTQYFIPIITIFLLLLFLTSYRNKSASRMDLKNHFMHIIVIYLLLFSVLIGLYILILSTALRYVLWEMFFLVPVTLILIAFSYTLINRVLFRVNLRRELKKRKYWESVAILIFVVIMLGLLVIPRIDYPKEPIFVSYEIYPTFSNLEWTFVKINAPIQINTLGYFGSFIRLIPIRYGLYNIEVDSNIGNQNFRLLTNSSKSNIPQILINSFAEAREYNSKPDKQHIFTNLVLDETRKLITLKYDNDINKEELNAIILEGYVNKARLQVHS